jgi:hypothetical protein
MVPLLLRRIFPCMLLLVPGAVGKCMSEDGGKAICDILGAHKPEAFYHVPRVHALRPCSATFRIEHPALSPEHVMVDGY